MPMPGAGDLRGRVILVLGLTLSGLGWAAGYANITYYHPKLAWGLVGGALHIHREHSSGAAFVSPVTPFGLGTLSTEENGRRLLWTEVPEGWKRLATRQFGGKYYARLDGHVIVYGYSDLSTYLRPWISVRSGWRISALCLPMWIPVALFAAISAAFELRRRRLLAIRAARGQCLRCGYDLRAHQPSDFCPECGPQTQVPTTLDSR